MGLWQETPRGVGLCSGAGSQSQLSSTTVEEDAVWRPAMYRKAVSQDLSLKGPRGGQYPWQPEWAVFGGVLGLLGLLEGRRWGLWVLLAEQSWWIASGLGQATAGGPGVQGSSLVCRRGAHQREQELLPA